MRPAALLLHACCTPEAEHASAHPDPRPVDCRQARLLTSRALGIDVDMCIVRCGRFLGLMAPGSGATDRPVSMCAVCTPSRILGCYELTDGLGGIMFRRMTDTVCRELLSTLAGLDRGFRNGSPSAPPPQAARGATGPQRTQHPARLRPRPRGGPLANTACSWRSWGSATPLATERFKHSLCVTIRHARPLSGCVLLRVQAVHGQHVHG